MYKEDLKEAYNNIVRILNTNNDDKIAFWGASLFLEEFLAEFNIENKNIIGVIDASVEKQGTKINNLQIYSPEDIQELALDKIILTIKNNHHVHYDKISKYLKEKGCIAKLFKIFPQKAFSSANYWENRYLNNGTSGAGSYNRLAEFKARVINSFILENNLKTCVEFGSGDGNQLAMFNIEKYLGYDVSVTILKKLKEKFKDDVSKTFKHVSEYDTNSPKADLSLSLDVIYHLIEDDVYEQYMQNLFSSSNKFVIVYSSNKEERIDEHVKHRKFTDYIDKNINGWKLKNIIKNEYLYSEENEGNTSFADFYIYEKINGVV